MALPQITIQGNVCLDPNLQFTPNGAPLCKIRIAAGERKKDSAGVWVDGDTVFLDCTVWGTLAEAAVEVFTKGTPVIVLGRLRSRTIDKDGARQTYWSVDVDSIAVDAKKSVKPDITDPWAAGTPF